MLNQYERGGGRSTGEGGTPDAEGGDGGRGGGGGGEKQRSMVIPRCRRGRERGISMRKRHWYGTSKRYDERALKSGTEGASMRVR